MSKTVEVVGNGPQGPSPGEGGPALTIDVSGPRPHREPRPLRPDLDLVPTPIAKDGLAFLWADNGVVTCIRTKDGTNVWRNRVGGNYYGSPVWIDGRLYCVDRSGNVVVLAASEKYELIAKVPLGEQSFATPAVARGAIYFRTVSKLMSLGGKP